MTFGRGASGEERVAMRRGEDWVAVQLGGGVTAPMRARLERRDGALRVTVRDDAVAPFALDGAPLHATAAHGCLTGAEPHGAWAELRL
jgi:hypothetical protein